MTTYKDSGVDVAAGNQLVNEIKADVTSTHNENVIDQYGGFAALCKVPEGYDEPILVSCTDGVGTKLKLAQEYNFHHTVGIDLVAMCINDLYCTGASPLFFLDYFATGKLDVEQTAKVVRGIALGCKQASCALVGGETAEMPGMYHNNDYDLAGFCVGVVERAKIHKPENVKAGQILVGLHSDGLHSNGYSLVRKIMEDHEPLLTDSHLPYFSKICAPTKIYTVMEKLNEQDIPSGVAHITGGGLNENIPRMLPEGLTYQLNWNTYQWPSVFNVLRELGEVPTDEMKSTFNCGIGMVLAIEESKLASLEFLCDQFNQQWSVIGQVRQGSKYD